jgi:hypothetical protein
MFNGYRLSIWSRLARLVSWCRDERTVPYESRGWRAKQAAAALVPGVVVFGLFAAWMIDQARNGLQPDPGLGWRMWLAGSWAALSSPLIVLWESQLLFAVRCIEQGGADEGWDTTTLHRHLRPMVAIRPWLCLGCGAAVLVGFLFSLSFFHEHAATPNWSQPALFIIAVAVVTYLGATFGMGFWGVALTTLIVLTSATRRVVWKPFDPRQVDGMEQLAILSFATGGLFSVGNVFTPGVLDIVDRLSGPARALAWVILVSLMAGGLIVFAVPALHLSEVARRQREQVLRKAEVKLERLWDKATTRELGSEWELVEHEVNALVSLRQLVDAQKATPVSLNLANRGALLLLLPVAAGILQTLTGLSV